MTADVQSRVTLLGASALIIYEHGLLGEGISARLKDLGVTTVLVPRCDPDAVASALLGRPTVVIAERTTAECLTLIETLSPGSRIVDVGSVIGRGCPDASAIIHFQAIMDALGVA